jgi:1-phosphofructokinase family hexose kinase
MIVTLTLNPSLDEWIELPRLALGRLNRATSFRRFPGGKGINVSRVVHELRRPTVAVGLAGGFDGALLRNLLDERGIAHRFVSVPGTTRNNYQLQTQTPKAITQVNAPGPRVPLRALAQIGALLAGLRRRAGAFVLSGSLPPGAPPLTYRRLVLRLARLGALTVLDSSGEGFREGVKARPWLIKPNREEAEELLGRRLSRRSEAVEAAAHLARQQAQVVILSMGADGAVLAARDHPRVLLAEPPAVKARSTVGAGDSLVAGFVIEWIRSRSYPEALRLGTACGAAAAMTSGTELCHRRDVLRLRPRVRIREAGRPRQFGRLPKRAL